MDRKNKTLTGLTKENTADVLALTPLQEGLLFHYLQDPDGQRYVEQLSLEISGAVDIDCFDGAWNVVVETNEMLRTVFRWEKMENPIQVVLKKYRLKPVYYDLSAGETGGAGAEKNRLTEEIKRKDRKKRFLLGKGEVPFRVTLCKLEEAKYTMIISNHHILYDGWSNGILLQEFFAAYNDLSAGKEPLRTVKTKFKEFIKEIGRRDSQREKTFWSSYLQGIDTPTELSIKGRKEKEITPGETRRIRFERNQADHFVKKNKITLAALLYSAWGLLLQKYNNSGDVIFGATVSGRSAKVNGIEEVVGLFINTLPLRVKTRPGEKIEDLLYRMHRTVQSREQYENTPLVDIKEYCDWSKGDEFFDSIVSIENYPLDSRLTGKQGKLSLDSYAMVEMTHYDLTVSIVMFEDIGVDFIYNKELFEREGIERLALHFRSIVEDIVKYPGKKIEAVDILSAAEKGRLLKEFNDTSAVYPADKTIHGLFEEQAAKVGDRVAVIGRESVSYKELSKKSGQLAYSLKEKGVKPDSIVGIMVERSVEMIIGILGILKAGGAYLPIDPDYPQDRIDYILKDSGAEILLATEVTGATERKFHSPFTPLAYIIYTSGSTGKPKGVMVDHASAANLLFALQKEYPFTTADVYLLKTSYIFDVSVAELFGWFFGGGRLAILEKDAEKDPRKILAAIEKQCITHINFVPPMFNVFTAELNSGNINKLTGLRYIFLAGEALLPGVVHQFRRLNKDILLENIYGPTEGTVYACKYSLSGWDGGSDIPIGKPIQNTKLYILDRYNRLQPIAVPGELFISGAGIARGYLNNPQLTVEKFLTAKTREGTRRINMSHMSHMSYFYKTGDLCRWLPDGNIEFLGRLDHQVKIRGFRVELGEIENRLLNHSEVKEVVVTAGSLRDGDRFLCAYIVVEGKARGAGPTVDRLREYLAQSLPDYMVPAFFVQLAEMPLTPSGKVDRKVLPEPEPASSKEYIAPRGGVEETLVKTWSQLLGIEKEKIGIDDNFFELGGHSLKASRLTARIHKKLDIEIPLAQLFKSPTVRQLAHFIDGAKKNRFSPIETVEKKEYYELSSFQERFFVFQQLEPEDVSYSVSEIMLVEGPLLKEKFGGIFKRLIRRHESLRTSFHLKGGEPVQRIHKAVQFEMEYDIAECKAQGANFVRPFDLSRAPQLRLGHLKVEREKHYLMFDMHHIISDGVSVGIFIKEFLALYAGEDLPPLRIQYKDYVAWRKKRKKKGAPDRRGGAGIEEEVLNLPTDFPRPAVPDFAGKTVKFELGPLEKGLSALLAAQEGTTLYMVLLSAFNIFLAKVGGQENIVVGSPIAGRLHPDLEGTVGLFINPLVLRNFPSGQKRFSEFLAEVKENALDAYDNQDYQYEELVEKISTAAETGRNPLYDVMFVQQNMEMPEIEIPGLKVIREVGENRTSKFDITLYCEERARLVFKLEYSTALFKQTTIQRFTRYFKKVISEIVDDPHKKISHIDILSGEEKQRILYDFNDTSREYPADKTIHQLFEEQARMTPHGIALAGSGVPHPLTYRELNEKSNRLAYLLRARGIRPGTIAGIMIERSPQMVVGIWAILKAGGAYLPIDPEYPQNRILSMLDSSGATILLSGRDMLQRQIPVLRPDELTVELQDKPVDNLGPTSGPGDLIYIIFTSGSTGKPKGAGVYHRGFMNLVHWFVSDFGLGPGDSNLLLTSLSFDLTQKNLYAPLVTGGTLCLPGVNYFDPRVLLREIHDNRVTWINCTPSMFYKLVEHEETAEKKRLSSLRYVFLGGEPISLTTLMDWLESDDHDAQIVNTYGPTECTDICASYRIEEPRRFLEETIPVGYAVYNAQLFILDKNLQPVPVGVPGELLIGGHGVGIGYINDPNLTAEKFCNKALIRTGKLVKSFVGGAGGRFFKRAPLPVGDIKLYKTGDLVKWLPDGAVEFLGRIDHQVKVRGFRIELGEIESRLLNYPGIKEVVVMAREGEGSDRYLCAYIVFHGGEAVPVPGIRDYLSAELPGYMVPAYFVILEKMPLNPNGKVDRKALPGPDVTAGKEYVPPGNDREKILVEIWAEVLGLDKKRIGIHDNFFQLGGHSLKAAGLMGRLHKAFSVEIPISQLFRDPTIESISQFITETEETFYTSIRPVEEKEYYALSSAQKRLFIIYKMDPASISYNLPAAVQLEGRLETGRLEEVFKRLTDRHESLRTSFQMVNDEPVQRIHKEAGFDFDLAAQDAFVRPFDLSRAPLLRVGLVKTGEEKYLLLFDMHHIISDGISMGIFIREFMAFYSGKDLPELRIHYKDITPWENRLPRSTVIERQERYWLKEMAGEIPVLELPTDYPRPAVKTSAGRSISFESQRGEVSLLRQLTMETGTTPFMVFLALFNLLLSKLSGREDIIVGTPAAGRSHQDLQHIIGIFINTLALRNYPAPGKGFGEFLQEVKENCLKAFENQDYQYEELVEKVVADRDLSRNSLFDAMLVMQNMEWQQVEIPGLKLTPREYEQQTSKFDLTLTVVENENAGRFDFIVTYCTALFKKETIVRFINYFKRAAAVILEDPDIRISAVDILPGEEKQYLLYNFNGNVREYPSKTVCQLFGEQAEKVGDRVAVTGSANVNVTYRELNKKSGRLSGVLRQKGARAGTIVAIMVEPSLEMITGLLAILKSGAAYLPIEPGYPEERKQYMLADSGARILLATEATGDTERKFPSPFTSLSYVIYTSGTTGKSKGTLVENGNLVNYLCWFIEKAGLTGNDRTVLTSSFGFDLGYTVVYSSLLAGCRLHIVPRETYLSPESLLDYIGKHRVTYIKVTPSLFTTIVESSFFSKEACRWLRLVVLGGEAIKTGDVEKAHAGADHIRFMNHYGPTEATIGCVAQFIDFDTFDRYRERPTIGSPIANTAVFILDSALKLVPTGTAGELCISGAGIARGYLNNPELTAAKFLTAKTREGTRRINMSHTSYMSHMSYIYKTGDLARWLAGGMVEFLGRIDSQVKIRGYRIETGEIENRLLAHKAVKEAAVVQRVHAHSPGGNYLCAYIVAANVLAAELKEFLAESLPDYMIPSYFVRLERIPLTPNGKLDGKLLPPPGIKAAAGDYAAPRNPLEQTLAGLWCETLGTAVEEISIDANFFELGGHSLNAIMLLSKIHKALDARITLTEIFKLPTIRGLSNHIKQIKGSADHRYAAVPAAEEKEYYTLSPAQKRLFILHRMDEGGTGYNMPRVVELAGEIDPHRLGDIFAKLVNRHEALRTSFKIIDGEPVQRIHEEAELDFDLAAKNAKEREGFHHWVRPFDLSRAPLLRVALIQIDTDRHIMVLDVHHIISDGVSMGNFVREFMALAGGEELPGLKLRYRDYSEWRNGPQKGDALIGQGAYWLRQFDGEIPVLHLPVDFTRPVVQSFEGHTVSFEVGPRETTALKKRALDRGSTLYMALIAVFNIFLARITGQQDIVVGTPVAGRNHADLAKIFGIFLNTLALRNYLAGEETIEEFFMAVTKSTLNAFENQDYPFEDLVEKVSANINRDAGRNPLFDVMFVLQNIDFPEIEVPGLTLRPYPFDRKTAKFDMTFVCSETADGLFFTVEYSTKLFKEETIERFVRYFKKIVSFAAHTPAGKIAQIEIIPAEEKKQLLFEFNDPQAGYPMDKTIRRLFAEQAEKTPGGAALVNKGTTLTYRQLNDNAARLAGYLYSKGIKGSELVGIMVERSLEMIIGILGILKSGCAYVPLNPRAPEARTKYILEECGIKMLLTGPGISHAAGKEPGTSPLPGGVPEGRGGYAFAYVIFTSGSTGRPKGVPITHTNICPLLHWGYKHLGLNSKDHVVQNLSYYFDWSVWEIFITLTSGSVLYITTDEVLLNPAACIDYMLKNDITVLHITPTQFQSLANGATGSGRKLETLEHLYIGAEKLNYELAKHGFALVKEDCRVFNMYGPTETTIMSAVLEVDRTGCERYGEMPGVPIGGPIANTLLLVLDQHLTMCPLEIGGELYIGGNGVSAGYLNKPQLTAEKFIKLAPHPSPLYKTGDLVKWLVDGAVEFLGRIDHQVKIRGFRIELGEIESRLLNYPGIKEVVVMAREGDGGDKYLCAYIVSHAGEAVRVPEVRDYLSSELPGYMVPAYFVALEKMPLNPNGKVDRKALPGPDVTAGKEYVPPRNDREKILVEIWAEVLGLDKKRIGIHDNFFQLGGHSLKAAGLTGRLHKAFSVEIPISRLFRNPTIESISRFIAESEETLYTSIRPVEEKEYYALSSAQKRLFVIYKMDPASISYNLPAAVQLQGRLETGRLEEVFKRLTDRHESLRTSFHMVNDEPVQRVHKEAELDFDLAAKNVFVRPFDLSRAPLLRVELINKPGNEQILMVDMHHIISDGISIEILVREFMALYSGEDLPCLTLRYKDYSQWQHGDGQRDVVDSQGEYWRKIFSGDIPVLDLPLDYPGPAEQDFEGSRIRFEISAEETGGLRACASREGVTLYMALLAVTYIFLAKISNGEDIVIGTPTAGRGHPDLQQLIGMFVNTLALRNQPAGEKTFNGFLGEIKKSTLAAFENQSYPYEELVERVVLNREAGRNPLFDVMFVLQDMDIPELEIGGLKLAPYSGETFASKFDLLLVGREAEGKLDLTFEYRTKLFKETTIRRFSDYFKKIIIEITANPGIKLSAIEIISPAEKEQILVHFNNTARTYPKDKTIPRLFAEQVAGAGDRVAVISNARGVGCGAVTYGLLNKKSNRLARVLKEKGVTIDAIVGLMVGRSIEMIVGILGILKAGGAYLPIDPDYPEERIDYMLKDSSTGILLKDDDFTPGALPGMSEGQSLLPETCYLQPATSLAYVIYTSGTTGKPKGTLTCHYNVARVIKDTNYINITPGDRILQLSNYAFDGSVFDIYGALLNGAPLVLVNREDVLAVDILADVITKEEITVFFITTALFNTVVDLRIDCLARIRKVLFGGEKVSPDHCRRALTYLGKERVIHVYGPTETTVYASYYFLNEIGEDAATIPIGKPISNTSIYILDNYMTVVPIGITGEVYIGGDGLARGYLNRPELTAEKFITLHPSPLYKTGDLCRWLPDGNIEFSGRMDNQVKIRGFRVELAEIESYLTKHHEINEAVVIAAADEKGEKYLSAYIVSDIDISVPGLRDYLKEELPAYMVPAYFTRLAKIPLTPNGKIDRKALPAPEAKAGGEYTAPRDGIEENLAGLWAEVLGVEKGIIGIDDNFFQLGGHSLKAAVLAAGVHREFNVKLPLARVFETPAIRGLAEYIREAEEDRFKSIKTVEQKEYYPLSSAQNRLYILQRMEEAGTGYNIPLAVVLEGTVDTDGLENVFEKLIKRHESFRTSFEVVGKEPVQRIHDGNYTSQITYYRQIPDSMSEIANIIKNFIVPFDLSLVPLLRIGLLEINETKCILIIDMHHIISDGTSMDVFVREFMALYDEQELSPLRVQYKDFSGWQDRKEEREAAKRREEYWLGEFSGEIPLSNLPTDFPRPAVRDFTGRTLTFEIDKEEAGKLKKRVLTGESTLFMVLLSLFNILLARISGQEEIIVGTPVAGRNHADLAKVIGIFVNTLALRNYLPWEETIEEFLRGVTKRTLKAFENRDYPFEDLVEKVSADINRDAGRNPLFDVMFVLQNIDFPEIEVPGLTLRPYPFDRKTAKFDMTFVCSETADGLFFTVEYSTKLFKEETIERFVGYFKKIVSFAAHTPAGKIARIEIIPAEEKKRLLFEFNDPQAGFLINKTMQILFAEQAEKTPGGIALVNKDTALTYRQLNDNADRLVHYLYGKGIKGGELVGIMVERSLEMIIGILGILKSGCGYVPLNPRAPEARTKYILDECNIKIVLTARDLSSGGRRPRSINHLHLSPSPVTSLAYVIFTSGSTGKPKGVPITHANICPLLHWGYKHLGLNAKDHVLQNLSYYFDWSVWEIFITLTSGPVLYITTDEVLLNPAACIDYMLKKDITVLHITPTQFQSLANGAVDSGQKLETLEHLYIGAEKLTYDLAKRSFALVKEDCRVFNMYGPTEATIMSAVLEIDRTGSERYGEMPAIPIGGPIANTLLLVLDKHLNMCPVNIAGELYIGGSGLSPGYLNNPELTAEKFIKLAAKNAREREGLPMINMSYMTHMSYIYKSGDLALWLPDGNIQFLGRIDLQVKIRGFRIELGEIEKRLSNHEKIKEVAVTVIEKGDGGGADKYLCAYIAAAEDIDIAGVKKHLAEELPGYMVPAYFVKLDRMPLNPNGKIDRKALPEPGIKTTALEYVPPENEIQEKLAVIWEAELGVKPIGIHDNFFDIGGHSLKIITLVNKIHKTFGVEMAVQQLFQFPTIAGTARVIESAGTAVFRELQKQPQKEYYELSYAQKRLWLLYKFEPENPAFNLPGNFTLYERVDENTVRKVLEKLAARHEAFRTYFKEIHGQPAQIILPGVPVHLEIIDLSPLSDDEREKRRARLVREESTIPFKPDTPPLFRVKLLKCKEEEFDVIVTMHHIISDGWSLQVLEQEFTLLYEAAKEGREYELQPLRIQYRDYVYWHNRLLADEAKMRAAKEFWESRLSGGRGSAPLDLPFDFPKTSLAGKESAGYRIVVPEEITAGLRKIATEVNASLFMVLLAAYNMLLSRVTGQEDILLGVPGAARRHDDLEKVIGLFVNTLVIRNNVNPGESFTLFLEKVRIDTLRTLEHQGYPLELICSEFKMGYPEISVFFNMLTFGNSLNKELEDFASYHIAEVQNAKFDIVIYLAEYRNGIEIAAHYYKELFQPATIERIMRLYLVILENISRDPGKELEEYYRRKKRRKLKWG